jgi:DNA polymerase II small subunit/DNA polymerase delta subunit B
MNITDEIFIEYLNEEFLKKERDIIVDKIISKKVFVSNFQKFKDTKFLRIDYIDNSSNSSIYVTFLEDVEIFFLKKRKQKLENILKNIHGFK